MAKIFGGDVEFGFVISQTGAQPLDSRSVVQNYEELLKSETFGTAIYNGMTVATVDEQKVYMLVDKTKATSADGWKEVGAGGAVAVDTYAEAEEIATNDNIGQVIYVKNSDETYEKAPYIVTGEGKLQKLAASNSDGTGLDADVAKLKETVGDADSGLVKSVADLNNNKVDKAEGERLMTDAEGTKLAGIAEGAEVNYVKSVGTNLDVDSDGKLTVDLSSKVDKNTYETKIGEISASLQGKADAQTLADHTNNGNIHVTIDDKAKWNNAEQNAKDYAKGLVMDGETPRFDAAGAAGTAEQNAKDYADSLVTDEEGKSRFDAAGAAGTAEQNAKDYADSLAPNYEVAGAAGTAEQNAKDYADSLAPNYEVAGAAATAKSEAIAEAKAYTDGIVNDTTTEDGSVVKGLNSRISDLEAIDHEKLASDASAAAVATVLDGAPEKFDTLKEVAQWIADSESAATAADLVTRVSALEAIDHDAYKAADTALETSLKGYVDGKDTAMDTRVKVLEAINHDAYKAADETLKGELEGEINLKADASALTAEISAREALTALVGTRAEGDSEDVFTKLAALVAKDGEIDGVLATKADTSALTAEISAREALTALVGTRAEGDSEDVFTKLANLADGKLTKDAKVNGVSFNENGEAIIDAGDIALDEAILSDDGKGGKTEQYPVSSSIQAVLQSLNNRITAAVSGGLTSVAAGSGIAVTDVIGNSQTVSIKVSATANNAVQLNTDGIYVEQIMVSGNDIEEITE